MSRFLQVCLALALWLGALNAAQDKSIQAKDFYAFATIAGSNVSAAFGIVRNTSKQQITLQKVNLIGVDGAAELHQTIEEKGVMKMLPVDSLEIPAKRSLELAPGGLHIMLINLTKPLEAGKSITLELVFDNGATLQLEAPIKERVATHTHHAGH